MKYTISNIRHASMEEDEDIVDFYFDIIFTEPEPLTTHSFYPFNSLLNRIRSAHPDFYTYIKQVKESLDDWGPNESKTIDAMGTEAVDLLYFYLEEYLLSCDWMESFYHTELEESKQSITRQQDNIERAEDVLNDWKEAADTMFDEQKRYRKFCRLVEKEALRIAVEVYPKLLDANKEQMKAFKYVFTNGIIKMYDDLSDHLDKIE